MRKVGRGRRGHHTTPPFPHRATSRHREGHSARQGREQPQRSPRGQKRVEEGTERPHGGPGRGHLRRGGHHPQEENADLQGLAPERAHLLFQGVYGDFLHHNDGLHLDG